ncbi:DUF3558 domain-containing protein [Sciscionella sediminilitoris]|uniref:DUF3558 domain-containing protein n=1 Tax=Sciscionella sediminilitoris TaxID=1445613 RepID=UPI0018D17883|nr:DUF3558 domain-containing protein [Sciscionella sp. SE31]
MINAVVALQPVKGSIIVVEQPARDATAVRRVELLMPRHTVRIAAAVAVLGLLTSCSSSTNSAAPSSAPASSSAAGSGSGPRVPVPLPTRELLDNPCTVLTNAEATDFGLIPPGEKTTRQLTACQWRSSDNGQNSIGMAPVPPNTGGISDIYDQKERQAYFEPTTVDGYPAVFADTQDGRPSGTCTLWLGVTDHLAVSIIPAIGAGPNRSKPCALAKKFGAAMLTHLKHSA